MDFAALGWFLKYWLLGLAAVVAFLAFSGATWFLTGAAAEGLDWFSYAAGMFWGALFAVGWMAYQRRLGRDR